MCYDMSGLCFGTLKRNLFCFQTGLIADQSSLFTVNTKPEDKLQGFCGNFRLCQPEEMKCSRCLWCRKHTAHGLDFVYFTKPVWACLVTSLSLCVFSDETLEPFSGRDVFLSAGYHSQTMQLTDPSIISLQSLCCALLKLTFCLETIHHLCEPKNTGPQLCLCSRCCSHVLLPRWKQKSASTCFRDVCSHVNPLRGNKEQKGRFWGQNMLKKAQNSCSQSCLNH